MSTELASFVHPAWCSGGPECQAPRVCQDGTTEWVHANATYIRGLDFRGQVALTWMADESPDGVLSIHQAVFINADGSATAEQAEQLGQAILAAARQMRAGLAPTDGA